MYITAGSDTITKTNPYNGQLHLENDETATPADGKVEVRLYNKWHPVCKNSAFTKTVADSMCDNMDTQKVKIYRLYILRMFYQCCIIYDSLLIILKRVLYSQNTLVLIKLVLLSVLPTV